ncbi:superoxide dismutase [Nemania abortiva]|nr:superoxide dismutase [Nemania abortiva]
MRLSNALSLSAMGTCVLAQNITGQLGDAIAVLDNPVGKQGIATLPDKPFFTSGSVDGNVKGTVKATAGANGVGVDFEVSFSNLPKEGGPFSSWSIAADSQYMPANICVVYHLHVDPVDASGNCTNTLAHLDPFIRGEDPACNSTRPETCQVGDLSGKYGKIMSDPFTAKFHDNFTSVREGPGSYFLNRSIVVHFANKTRITCANFAVLDCTADNATTTDGSCQSSSTPTPHSGSSVLTVKNLALLPMIAMFFAL